MEKETLELLFILWAFLTMMSLISIKTWIENQFFYIREEMDPNINKLVNYLGELIVISSVLLGVGLILFK